MAASARKEALSLTVGYTECATTPETKCRGGSRGGGALGAQAPPPLQPR